ncbi:MAG: exosome complex protein Rrp42 [Candidatus Micrarchaeota archaeon]
MEIEKEISHDMVENLLKQGKRGDGRKKLEYREIKLQKNVIPNAEGSALCSIGKTQLLSAVKIALAKPYPDRPEDGILSTSAEFTPLGSPYFEPGPPRAGAIELARVVDRGIRSSECINLKKHNIENSEFVLATYIDLWILDHDGNLFDAAMLASMSALQNTRMPKVEEDKIIRDEIVGKLKLSTSVVSCTFTKIGENLLLDPAFEEEIGAEAMLTIGTTPEYVCAVQKSKRGGLTQKDILELVDISFDKGKELRKFLD